MYLLILSFFLLPISYFLAKNFAVSKTFTKSIIYKKIKIYKDRPLMLNVFRSIKIFSLLSQTAVFMLCFFSLLVTAQGRELYISYFPFLSFFVLSFLSASFFIFFHTVIATAKNYVSKDKKEIEEKTPLTLFSSLIDELEEDRIFNFMQSKSMEQSFKKENILTKNKTIQIDHVFLELDSNSLSFQGEKGLSVFYFEEEGVRMEIFEQEECKEHKNISYKELNEAKYAFLLDAIKDFTEVLVFYKEKYKNHINFSSEATLSELENIAIKRKIENEFSQGKEIKEKMLEYLEKTKELEKTRDEKGTKPTERNL